MHIVLFDTRNMMIEHGWQNLGCRQRPPVVGTVTTGRNLVFRRRGAADPLARKQSTLGCLWEPRLCGQMADLPPLDAVIRETERWLRE
jgi:hypothetical protein